MCTLISFQCRKVGLAKTFAIVGVVAEPASVLYSSHLAYFTKIWTEFLSMIYLSMNWIKMIHLQGYLYEILIWLQPMRRQCFGATFNYDASASLSLFN